MLIIGVGGMLGTAWAALCDQRHLHYQALDYPDFDLTAENAPGMLTRTLHDHQLNTLVNCAAWTDVDAAETHEPDAAKINDAAVATLAKVCADTAATLVHYSTDYVFPGDSPRPYRVDDPIAPINAYGRTKATGEQHLLTTPDLDYRLIRTSWLYAPWGGNFVRTMLRLTAERDTLRVVDDQRGRPTSAQHLAAASLALIEQAPAGVYHVTDSGQCTWYELTRFIAEQSGAACHVQPCTTAEFPRPAKRPANSVLDITQTERILGPMPHWHDNVAAVLKQLETARA